MPEVTLEAHGRTLRMDAIPGKAARCWEAGYPWEAALLEHIYDCCVDGLTGLAVDAGAQQGNHTLWFAAVCCLQVVAFEPVHYERLARNVAMNGLTDVRIGPVALGAEAGRAAHVGKGCLTDDARGPVPVRRLDDYELEPVLLKLDIEDMEPSALRGAEETIRHARPVIFVEMHDDTRVQTADVLGEFGYQMTERWPQCGPMERWDHKDGWV